MNLKSVKSIKDVKLPGLKADWIKEDSYIREFRLTAEDGTNIVIRASGGYSDNLRIFTEVPEDDAAA
jgi:hypothetical protein